MEGIYAGSNMSRTRENKQIVQPGSPDPHVIRYHVVAPLTRHLRPYGENNSCKYLTEEGEKNNRSYWFVYVVAWNVEASKIGQLYAGVALKESDEEKSPQWAELQASRKMDQG